MKVSHEDSVVTSQGYLVCMDLVVFECPDIDVYIDVVTVRPTLTFV